MATRKGKALGRGLEALFTDININENNNKELITLDINEISPNPNQPRKLFDSEKIDELAESIKAHGIIQPIIVKAVNSGYEIIAGERRWRAARKAGLKEVPCIIKDIDEQSHMLFAIIENLQREDLNPIEEAKAFDSMLKEYNMTQEDIAKSVGKSRPYIANTLRLLKLPEEIQLLILENKITSGHARALINIEDKQKQKALVLEIIEKGLNVRQTEKAVEENKTKGSKKNKSEKRRTDPQIINIQEDLKRIFGTKVTINHRNRKGTVEIEYYSQEELERLIEMFKELENI
ncbi:MAG: ParB/RepB/Spo0J family partition protein [Clostridiales bacterium]|nr:ParB/RepB/Spo0J family partition protein [Clostridiales bacterium]